MHIRTYMGSMENEEHIFWRKYLKNEKPFIQFRSEYDIYNRIINRLRKGIRYPKRKNIKLDFKP